MGILGCCCSFLKGISREARCLLQTGATSLELGAPVSLWSDQVCVAWAGAASWPAFLSNFTKIHSGPVSSVCLKVCDIYTVQC